MFSAGGGAVQMHQEMSLHARMWIYNIASGASSAPSARVNSSTDT